MWLLLLCDLFSLSLSLAWWDPWFCINHPARVLVCHYNYTLAISCALSPSLESVPSLFLCCNRKMWPPPRVQLDFDFSLLLLLGGDVSLNPGPGVRGLRLRTVNACSMRDKAPALSDLVASKTIDFLGITETWLTMKETSTDLVDIIPEGLSFFHKPRIRRRGGGVCLFMPSAHKFTAICLPTQTSFEAISGKIKCDQSCLIIFNIYRPSGPATAFFGELEDNLSYISTLPHDLALMGDFNLCIDSSSSDAGQLSGILESFDLHQYVDFPTHIHDHSLDLMMFSSGCKFLSFSASDFKLDFGPLFCY